MQIDEHVLELKKGSTTAKVATDSLGSDASHIYPFGSPAIDVPIGGGIYSGKIYELYGKKSSGKSTLAEEISKTFAAYWELQGVKKYAILWIETESAFDKARALYMECPIHKFIWEEAETVEDAHGHIKGYLDRCAKKGMKLIIVWDTLAAASIKSEITRSVDAITGKDTKEEEETGKKGKSKKNPGGLMEKPRLIKGLLRTCTGQLGKTDSTLILVNQIYKGQGTIETPGGEGVKFHASVRGAMQIDETKARIMPNGDKQTIAIITEIFYEKNKLTTPKQKTKLWINVESGLDLIETNLLFLKDHKMITAKTGGYCSFKIPKDYFKKGKKKETVEISYQNGDAFRKLMAKHPHLNDYVHHLIYQHWSNSTPLIKVRNIDHIWRYEEMFCGKRVTTLTEKEIEVAKLLKKELKQQDEPHIKGK